MKQQVKGPNVAQNKLTRMLAEATVDLENALDAEGFLGALESNGVAWREIARLAPQMGLDVPEAAIYFALSLSARPHGCVNDSEVEALIAINRTVLSQLDEAPQDEGFSENPFHFLWRSLLDRINRAPDSMAVERGMQSQSFVS